MVLQLLYLHSTGDMRDANRGLDHLVVLALVAAEQPGRLCRVSVWRRRNT